MKRAKPFVEPGLQGFAHTRDIGPPVVEERNKGQLSAASFPNCDLPKVAVRYGHNEIRTDHLENPVCLIGSSGLKKFLTGQGKPADPCVRQTLKEL
jgi:hypothetical protein